RALGLEPVSPTVFRLFDIVLKDGSVEPAPAQAFERVLRAALVKLPFVVRGEESDVTGALFIDVDRLRPSPLPPSPEVPSPPDPPAGQFTAEPAATAIEASTQENVFFDDVTFQNLAGFGHFGWGDIERLNVIIGANDTGKSHLLKILYAL